MELTGKVFKIFEARSGISAKTGKQWVSQSFLLETRTGEHGQYTRKTLLGIFGEDEIKKAQLFEGKEITVSFDIEARESTQKPGTWYNDLRVWKVEQVGGQQAAYAPTPQYQQQQPQQPQYRPQQLQNGFFQPQGGGYPPNAGYYQQQPQFPPQGQGEQLPF